MRGTTLRVVGLIHLRIECHKRKYICAKYLLSPHHIWIWKLMWQSTVGARKRGWGVVAGLDKCVGRAIG